MTLLSDAGNVSKRGFVLAVILCVLMPGWLVYSWVFKSDSRPPPADASVNLSSGRAQKITPPDDIKAEEQKVEKKQTQSTKPGTVREERQRPPRQKQKSALQQMQEKMRLAAYYLPPGVKGVGIDGRRQSETVVNQNTPGEQVKEIPSTYNAGNGHHQNSNAPREGASGSVWTSDFYERGSGQVGQYQRASSPYVVYPGSTIEARLNGGINTDLPGQITATVTRDVMDSATGKYCLIPGGSTLVGAADTRIGYGQERIPSAWAWLYLPNKDRIPLIDMPGADRSGVAGIKGKYNGHLWSTAGRSLLLTITGAAADMARSSGYGSSGDLSFDEALSRESGQQLDRRSREVWGRGGYRRPTLTAESGEVFLVQVTQELRFPGPYQDQMNVDFAEVNE